jgi:hypothetical protein
MQQTYKAKKNRREHHESTDILTITITHLSDNRAHVQFNRTNTGSLVTLRLCCVMYVQQKSAVNKEEQEKYRYQQMQSW